MSLDLKSYLDDICSLFAVKVGAEVTAVDDWFVKYSHRIECLNHTVCDFTYDRLTYYGPELVTVSILFVLLSSLS